MTAKFKFIKIIECTICHGKGHIEHPDGDIEPCTLCNRRGGWEIEVDLNDALRDLGILERDAMNWKTTAEALAQQRDEYRERYRGMSDALRIMTEVFARID